MHKLSKSVTLKGTNEGFYLYLDDQASVEMIFEEAEKLFTKIKKDNQYDESFDLTIDTGSRLMPKEKKDKLSKMIKENTNFDVKKFKEHVVDLELAEVWHKETSPMLMVKNIRNGQIIQSDRDIILLGDVRPGALIRSTGSIVIIGEVHGTVHAGSDGDEDVVIVAPFAFSGQVRIGEHIEIIEVDQNEASGSDQAENKSEHKVVYLNDLHVIEFGNVNKLEKIRPDFAKDLGGFREWQKQL